MIRLMIFSIFFSVIFFQFSCSNTELKEMNELISTVDRTPTSQEKEVLNGLKTELIRVANLEMTTKTMGARLYKTEDEFNKIDFSVLPYYELNEEEFFLNPASDNIMNCIHPVEEKILYVGKKQGNIVMVLEAIKANGEWNKRLILEGYDYFVTHFSWLPQRLMDADNKDYYMLDAMGHIYIVYFKDKEPVFCSFTGTNFYNKSLFASTMLNLKNLKDAGEKFMMEQKSK